MPAPSWLSQLGFIATCFLPALTGAFFRPREWYERLKKPSGARQPTVRAGVDSSISNEAAPQTDEL